MNTLENLINTYGIEKATAQRMIDTYKSHIGEEYGENRVVDITYIGNRERKIEIECTRCGHRESRVHINGRNKLRELPKKCSKCEAKRKEQKKRAEEETKNNVIQNEIGKIYGDYEVISHEFEKYLLRCTTCGHEKAVIDHQIYSGRFKGTRCTKHWEVKIKYDESYIGRKKNRLTIEAITRDNQGKKAFLCQCDCGNKTIVKPIFWENESIKSCGCYQENRSVGKDEIKRIKDIYHGMKSRCLNPNNTDYYNYGGRGIKICDEWLENVENFIKWSLENGYDNRLTIDRIDFNGNYEPDNCRWATYKVQNVNRRPRGKKWQDQQTIKKEVQSYSA